MSVLSNMIRSGFGTRTFGGAIAIPSTVALTLFCPLLYWLHKIDAQPVLIGFATAPAALAFMFAFAGWITFLWEKNRQRKNRIAVRRTLEYSWAVRDHGAKSEQARAIRIKYAHIESFQKFADRMEAIVEEYSNP